jgi:hypothetical protein
VVDHYIFLARVARRTSDIDVERGGLLPEEGGGGIPSALAELVTDAAALVVEQLWHPVRKRPVVKRRLKTNCEAESRLRSDSGHREIQWSPPTAYG